MRILIVTHYFPPETGAPQARLSALAATWAADGDAVTVLTGMPNHPTGVIPPEYRGALRRQERRDGRVQDRLEAQQDADQQHDPALGAERLLGATTRERGHGATTRAVASRRSRGARSTRVPDSLNTHLR